MVLLADIVSWVCLLLGSFFCLVGGIGLVRLPDFFSRIHAGGITDTMGATLLLIGLMPQAGLSLVTVKLLFLLVFLLITSPISSHATARAAHAKGLVPWTRDGGGEEERP